MDIAEEIHFVNATLRRVDLEIRRLNTLRTKLRRRLNQLNASPNVLPPETLSLIFEAACALPSDLKCHDPHLPLILASVCSHWRRVAYGTPTIWQALIVRAHDQNIISKAALTLVQLYAHHVGALTLSLGITFAQVGAPKRRRLPRTSRVPVSEFFKFILRECAIKLGALVLIHVPRQWWSSLPTGGPHSILLPRLKRISFSWAEKSRDPALTLFQEDAVPQLTQVSLSGQRLPINLPWNRITFLELEEMNVEQCIGLLVQCSNLIEYHCRRSILPSPHVEPGSVRRVNVVPYLECLSWDFGLAEWDTVLMAHASFPSLRRLAWRENSYRNTFTGDSQESSYRSLRSQFMSRLQTLTVLECSLRLWNIEELCAALPSTIQELYLVGGQSEKDVLHCLRTLTDTNDDTLRTPYLPHLHVLSMTYLYSMHVKPPNLVTSILEFLRSRREGPPEKWRDRARLQCLRLVEPISDLFEKSGCSPAQLGALQWLVQDGVKLDIEDGRRT